MTAPTEPLLAPTAELEFEAERIKGSRFLALVAPVVDEAAASGIVARLRAAHPGATHHCYAWRLGARGARFRSNDDGEPAGSAGRPILSQLEGHRVTGACVVVTRWFGGTKLGVGGLMRAYGGAAGMALDRTPLAPIVVRRRVLLAHPYECSGPIDGLLSAWNLLPLDATYGAEVQLVLEVPEDDLASFRAEVRDRTGARATMKSLDAP